MDMRSVQKRNFVIVRVHNNDAIGEWHDYFITTFIIYIF